MSKFCTECGKKIEDGKVCECKKAKKESSNSSFDIKESFLTIWETTKNMFKSPITVAKNFCKEANLYSGIIIIVLVALISGLGGLLTVNKMMSGLDFNGFEIFMKFFAISLIPVVINILAYLFIYNIVFKSKVTWKRLVTAFSGIMILEVLGCLLGFLCTYINEYLALIVFVFTIAVYLIQFITVIKHVTDIEEDKNVWAFAISLTVAAVISYLIVNNIMSDMFSNLMTASFYSSFLG